MSRITERMSRTQRAGRLALVALAALLPVAAQAQDDPVDDGIDPGRVELALEQTDQMLERAREIVGDSQNERAAEALRRAVEVQAQAKASFREGELALAARLTLQSRELAYRAVQLAQGDAVDGERIKLALQRTHQLLERLTEIVRECGNERAEALLRSAFEMQARAEVQFREGNFRHALELTLKARELAENAARLCKSDHPIDERVETVLEKTDAAIQRAMPIVRESGNERAESLLEGAVRLQRRAWSAFEEENEGMALRLTETARDHVQRAVRIARSEGRDDPGSSDGQRPSSSAEAGHP